MNILLLGSTGMLGAYMKAYFSTTNHTIQTIDIRKSLIEEHIKNYDLLINCVGIIKPRVKQVGSVETIRVNSLLPWQLQELCLTNNKKMIHVSTDCVFSGKTTSVYSETSPSDAEDLYGKSKYIGEIDELTTIRTSIIGEELKNKYSLIEWVKSSNNKTVNGFTNHYWSGVTCLQLAEFIDKNMIAVDNFWKGMRHVYSTPTNKFDLVKDIASAFNLNVTVEAKADKVYCNRALKSIYPGQLVDKSIRNQLIDLNQFSKILQS
jgi:dTDP-4-dehydrorhamnose reductase